MTNCKLSSVFSFYQSWVLAKGIVPCREEACFYHLGHLAWMCEVSIREFIPAGRLEKAMRWLGFIQGCLVSQGWFTLDDVKKHSRPDEERVQEVVA